MEESPRTQFLQEFTAALLNEVARRQFPQEKAPIKNLLVKPELPKNIQPFPVIRTILPHPLPLRRMPPQEMQPRSQMPMQKIELATLAKISAILSDPATSSIECPGPDKPLMVSRRGLVQSIPLQFTTEEITAIMTEISKKTRIPLGTGVFKAVLGNLLITAVSSEFIGTRFLLQKK
ncbi:MAG TPA: hypothetical protein VJK03_04010 [Candidatus Nanoarchaeia archaeon]|nr:hypothetical protein [Candidatus Nanoarchaeia archaeon]